MGLGPIDATRQALDHAGLTMSDVDLVEINEAFAVQVLGSARVLQIDEDKLNVSGEAIALGHPYGMTGARITGSLINNLQAHDKQIGLETMCVGGGQGMAMPIERLAQGVGRRSRHAQRSIQSREAAGSTAATSGRTFAEAGQRVSTQSPDRARNREADFPRAHDLSRISSRKLYFRNAMHECATPR